jgi:hypothetical protein
MLTDVDRCVLREGTAELSAKFQYFNCAERTMIGAMGDIEKLFTKKRVGNFFLRKG